MNATTKPSSGRKPAKPIEFSPEAKERFDGLLDLLSAKNVKIGILVEELAHCQSTMEKALDSVIPSVRMLLERRIRSAEGVLKQATH
jgi:hypothetical protein